MEAAVLRNKTHFTAGVQWQDIALVPTLDNLTILPRPTGCCLSNSVSGMVKVKASGIESIGFADSSEKLVQAKATSEALERLVMQAFSSQRNQKDTSNGWACHFNLDSAIQNALCELVERDVAITAWENGGPFYLVPELLWPEEIRDWQKSFYGKLEYSNLKIVVSQTSNGCSVSCFLFNDRSNCVAAHSSKLKLEDAIISSFMECLRAAHSALRLEHFSEVMALHAGGTRDNWEPGAHSVAYAYGVPFPFESSFIKSSAEEIKVRWSWHQTQLGKFDLSEFEILGFKIMDRVVVRLRHPSLRQIYWGPAKNRNELTNKHPHTVG